MKGAAICLSVMLTCALQAQDFEGVLRWKMEVEVDPAVQRQMEESLKMMQSQMNDPAMQEMIKNNPQMKAQMEAMQNMAQGGGMASMIPSEIVVSIKERNTLVKLVGGIMPMQILTLTDKNESYILNHEEKTFYSLGPDEGSSKGPSVTRTTESR